MGKSGRKSRMFYLDRGRPIKTWNPVIGCKHHCYFGKCWANRMAQRLRNNWRYKDGFDHPKLIEAELHKRFRGDTVVFVSSMGDLFGKWVPDEWIFRVIEAMKRSPETTFFLETKNPKRYNEFIYYFPENIILSTTIETNRDYVVSKAPPTYERYLEMREFLMRKHVSIEPIMDFDLKTLVEWMREIEPEVVSVGYDNYNAGLPEPSLKKTIALINQLKRFTRVEKKGSL